jgi:hypothetical protein
VTANSPAESTGKKPITRRQYTFPQSNPWLTTTILVVLVLVLVFTAEKRGGGGNSTLTLDCANPANQQYQQLEKGVTEFSVTVLPGENWTNKLPRPKGATSISIDEYSAPIWVRVVYHNQELGFENFLLEPGVLTVFKGKIGSVSFWNESASPIHLKIYVKY